MSRGAPAVQTAKALLFDELVGTIYSVGVKVSLSIRDPLIEQLRSVALAAGVSDSSVAEVALKRLFAIGDQEEIIMTLLQEGASARRYTRKTWLEAFYAALRELVPSQIRTEASGYEFMHYDVMASAERANEPDRIVIHTMEANLPTMGATSYNGTLFSATIDTSPLEAAKKVVSWLQAQPENRAK